MPHFRRLCRLSSRQKGRPDHLNYFSDKAWRKAKRRRQLQKAGRKTSRGK